MRLMSNGRARRTESEWQEILARWQASGQGVSEFCRAEGVHPESLRRWRQQMAGRPGRDFVAVAPKPSSSTSLRATDWALEVTLPNGVQLRFRVEA